ncbi:MAG: alpha/beta fold hydrolase [Bacteriovoracaceae bacterium]|jgi:alpha-beta hydrolase superfamily lysophospholipase|nr:hypothetical protein [Halobacteriovoraceae bacterium]MDP7319766.1 alpha/beta fold hydrolase [Bacteriovoracaceae bacterium]
MIGEEKKIFISDDISLHAKIYERGNPVWLIVTHGLGEHGQRHEYLEKIFSQYFNICLYDLRGHGRSSGKRGHIDSFQEYSEDLKEVLDYLHLEYEMDKYVLFGHSMGGLITASFMQNTVSKHLYPQKVFLSGPAVAGAGCLGKLFQFTPLPFIGTLSNIPFSVALEGLLDISKLSHDPRVYENYIQDPLNTLKIQTKLFFELLKESKKVFSRPLRIECDLFCAVAMSDALVDSEAVVEYFTSIEKNSTLYKATGAYHEIHNEIEKYREPYFKFLKDSLLF